MIPNMNALAADDRERRRMLNPIPCLLERLDLSNLPLGIKVTDESCAQINGYQVGFRYGMWYYRVVFSPFELLEDENMALNRLRYELQRFVSDIVDSTVRIKSVQTVVEEKYL